MGEKFMSTGSGKIENARGLRLGGTSEPAPRPIVPTTLAKPTPESPRVSAPSMGGGVPAKALPEPLPTTTPSVSPIDFIYNSEARKDKDGNLAHYVPPSNDGGIAEFAGITKRHHPEAYARIAALPAAERAKAAKEYLEKYTSPATKWSNNPAVQALLRDAYFHRGPGGVQAIVQIALGGKPARIGNLTPDNIAALNAMEAAAAIDAITNARQRYEDEVVGVRPNLAKGLSNRFQNAKNFSISQLKNLTG